MHGTAIIAEPEHQATMSSHIFRIVFNHFSIKYGTSDFFSEDHSVWSHHLPERVG